LLKTGHFGEARFGIVKLELAYSPTLPSLSQNKSCIDGDTVCGHQSEKKREKKRKKENTLEV